MSIAVALEDLAEEIAARGPGYLLTTSDGSRPHVMHVRFEVEGRELRTGIGRSAAANLAVERAVTLLWPPIEDGGYSLIVDGEATVEHTPDDDDDVEQPRTAVITPVAAVLHRPA